MAYSRSSLSTNVLLVDNKYITLVGPQLDRFKSKGKGLYNARCPICGDSKKKKSLARFFFIPAQDHYQVYCQNCGFSKSFKEFLRNHDAVSFSQYQLDIFELAGGRKPVQSEPEPLDEEDKVPFKMAGLTRVPSLSHNHPAKRYIDSRKIPPDTHHRLYFTPHFGKWVNTMLPNKLPVHMKFDPRIVMLLKDRQGNVFGFQGRSISPKSTLRYITIRLDDKMPKVFGLEIYNPNYRGIILEGPIDSLFMENSLAMVGSDVSLDSLTLVSGSTQDRIIVVYDNEPRNAEVVSKMEKAIDLGYNVCVWPTDVKAKDINLMVTNEHRQPTEIRDIIARNTYKGLKAKLQLGIWRKDLDSK